MVDRKLKHKSSTFSKKTQESIDNLRYWNWQFLRRNKDFKQSYQAFHAVPDKAVKSMLEEAFRGKWGMNPWDCDPDKEEPPKSENYQAGRYMDPSVRVQEWDPFSNTIFLSIPLMCPLELIQKQVEELVSFHAAVSKKHARPDDNPRRRDGVYKDYLRVWDMRQKNVTYSKIAEQIFKGNKSDPDHLIRMAKRYYKACDSLINGGYLQLSPIGTP